MANRLTVSEITSTKLHKEKEQMKKIFLAELYEFTEFLKQQLHKLKQKNERWWLILLPVIISLVPDWVWLMGSFIMMVYFVCDSKD
jgi:hypothetical protein